MMVNTISLKKKFYDPMANFREMVIAGVLTNGPEVVGDPRSTRKRVL